MNKLIALAWANVLLLSFSTLLPAHHLHKNHKTDFSDASCGCGHSNESNRKSSKTIGAEGVNRPANDHNSTSSINCEGKAISANFEVGDLRDVNLSDNRLNCPAIIVIDGLKDMGDGNKNVDMGDIDATDGSSLANFNAILLIPLILIGVMILALIFWKMKWGSLCYELVTKKKFISKDGKIVDSKDGCEIRFKKAKNSNGEWVDTSEPIEIEVQESMLSTSKVIALLGATAILIILVGFGAFAMIEYYFSNTIPDREISKIMHFLLGGSVLFVPYIINKLFDTGRNLTQKK